MAKLRLLHAKTGVFMIIFRSLGLAALLLAAPAALAQDIAPLPVQSGTFSEQQLRNFAKAVIDLRALSDVYSPRLAAASMDNAKGIRAEARAKAAAAMKKYGLSPEQYGKIQKAAQEDSALDKRISGYLDELTAAAKK
jgi:hypothetical protein